MTTTPPKHIAIIGGGIAGLTTAYHLKRAQPNVEIDIYERGSEASYHSAADDSHRASLGASSARTMRLMGAGKGVGEWNVRQTFDMLQELRKKSTAKLFYPEASVFLGKPSDDDAYNKSKKSLTSANVAYSELTGAQAKKHFPNIYNTLPDNARVLVEEPYHIFTNPTGVAGVIDQAALMAALRQQLEKSGARFHFNAEVSAVNTTKDKAKITFADGSTKTADHVVIAPGHWIENLVDTQSLGIETRLDRVVMARIDMKALGLPTNGFPFSKGFVPEDGKGSFYSFNPQAESGVLKFLPSATTRPVDTIRQLHAKPSETEKDTALTAAAARLGIDKEALRKHTTFIACAYTCPKVGEKALITPLSEHSTLIGLDSSGSARTIGGMGHIAANLALGLPEPHIGAYEAFGLAAHHKQNDLNTTQVTPDAAEIIARVSKQSQRHGHGA